MVRGAHIPVLLTRELVSATVAPAQSGQHHAGITLPGNDETPDPPGSEELRSRLAELEAQFSPETLRAFDYEQPPFSPECDISRNVMTTRGLQLVRPNEATELLRLPAGTTARDPLLPCEGYLCARLDLD